MTPSSVTCPHCQASFRITNAQLSAADGSVRCGSCLQVFNAMEQVERAPVKPATSSIENLTTTISEQATPLPNDQPESKPETPQGSAQATKQERALKAKTTSSEHDFHQQQTIETLIQKLDEQENQEIANARQRRGRRAGWAAAALALSLLLFGQFAWFNRQELSLNPALRGFYDVLCQMLPCTLPPMVDIRAIRSMELVVRSHPDQQNILQVDAIIINEASHVQPFPNLQLTFTDINGNVVANRSFAPAEYLAGELAGSMEMPRAQPVRLELEIIDPGEKAVNYQLKFSENKITPTP